LSHQLYVKTTEAKVADVVLPVADRRWQDFLTALRFAGMAVGHQELARLQHLFHLQPTLDRQGLKTLLACTLVKHEAHRDVFDALFEDWCPPEDLDAALTSEATRMATPGFQEITSRRLPSAPTPPMPPPIEDAPPIHKTWWRWGIILLLLIGHLHHHDAPTGQTGPDLSTLVTCLGSIDTATANGPAERTCQAVLTRI
jgi:hypothetical protein